MPPGGIRMSVEHEVGPVVQRGVHQPVGVPLGRHHPHARPLQQQDQALAQQRLVLAEDYPHGSSARSRVPVGAAGDAQVAAQDVEPVAQPEQTGAGPVGARAAAPVVGDVDREHLVREPERQVDLARARRA